MTRLILFLMTALSVQGEYKNLQWGSRPSQVKDLFPNLKKLTKSCYFDGVNVFGNDSLTVYQDSALIEFKYRNFLFLKNELVAVERVSGLNRD